MKQNQGNITRYDSKHWSRATTDPSTSGTGQEWEPEEGGKSMAGEQSRTGRSGRAGG